MEQKITISSKFAGLNFILSLFIVFLHSDCTFLSTNQLVKQSFLFAGTFFDVAVPLFFFLSAFWFYAHIENIEEDFFKKIIKRVHSIVIPYLSFSAIYIIWNTIMSLTWLKQYSTYSFLEVPPQITLKIWILAKCDPAIWFIRPLIILQFISLPFYIFIKKNILIGPVSVIIFIITNIILQTRYSAAINWLPMFILGIWAAVYLDYWYGLVSRVKKKRMLGGVLFLLLLFWINTIYDYRRNDLYYLYRNFGSLLFFFFFFLFVSVKQGIIEKLNRYSFFIFMLHYPIVFFIKKILGDIFSLSNMPLTGVMITVIYIVTILLSVIIIIFIYKSLYFLFPQIHFILNGRRKVFDNMSNMKTKWKFL